MRRAYHFLSRNTLNAKTVDTIDIHPGLLLHEMRCRNRMLRPISHTSRHLCQTRPLSYRNFLLHRPVQFPINRCLPIII
ncbi:hypothetical protein HBI56_075340 [Parastagonospora nodorum]|uniref:Uncharacterized protein n=1 Tax=Phaeosphaeria nodorum (strain SN15 / ATCC MYA-4574 / FGSC 10173) TaxID=321614 RepID=A0A7U2HZH9_PHANO|nr:hypothetical protein HBH56_169650 [Parastagonospora nodorum]QRC94381.1 hypothetical protein JI435_405720 [Parastagonospora nodorum SN15]KAH3928519.1 hypothetical protein HBH54_138200 [Parastagonospora nodorum]KAH3945524.1 hypothetical protein HBH53_143550 [Parastagonospora nodorum]KAH3983659.1 hypothetical protein HBH52_060670 [Parastagonospora nodorum]